MAKKRNKKQGNIPAYLVKRKKSNLFTFQRYKKKEGGTKKRAKHPKLIVEEKGNIFGFMGLTESEKHGHHRNIPLSKNPKKGDTRKAYIHTDLRYGPSKDFEGPLEDYKLDSRDKLSILEWLKKKCKKIRISH